MRAACFGPRRPPSSRGGNCRDAHYVAGQWRNSNPRVKRLDELFAAEPDRLSRLSFDACRDSFRLVEDPSGRGLVAQFVERARRMGFAEARDALFAGGIVNPSEGRPASHVAERGRALRTTSISPPLRASACAPWSTRSRPGRSARHRHAPHRHRRLGARAGAAGRCAGPAAARVNVRFLSNIDGEAFEEAVSTLDPATTLVVVASKTFTTAETLANMEAALDWLRPPASPIPMAG